MDLKRLQAYGSTGLQACGPAGFRACGPAGPFGPACPKVPEPQVPQRAMSTEKKALFLLFPNYINLTQVRRSFHDNGPMELMDKVKDIAQAVLEDKDVLTKYD